ncbi:unnamed protein product [Ilex paraguariensis]|uniref:Uncharacterized protein n=1 Tax=Ilex paraguariensis TaxID=185542 RepID=A0ABC8RD04_9AQUA
MESKLQPLDCEACLGIVYDLAYYKDKQLMEHVQATHINPALWIIIVGRFGVVRPNITLIVMRTRRSSQLRRLRVVIFHDLSTESLNVVVKKLPLLEELHLYYTYIDKEAIETIGCCCPLLKSFTYNQKWFPLYPMENDDDEALAIAKNMPGLRHLQLLGNINMPGLRHLQLLGNSMTNNGLQALIDGCPHLDSLDLRQCFNIELDGDLGKRCSKIKDMKLPFNPTEGYEFDTSLGDMEPPDDTFEDFWW